MKNAKAVDPSKLLSMSATLLAFAKPLLDQLPNPPMAKSLQGVMNIASLVWNIPLYERARHPKAKEYRAGLDAALADIPHEGNATVAVMANARATTYAADPRLAFAEVVAAPSGKAEVRTTAFLLERPKGA